VLPVVVLALAAVLATGALARAQVTCVDGARAVARALARGDDAVTARGEAAAVLGRTAAVRIEAGPDGTVQVGVQHEVRTWSPSWAPGGLRGLGVTCEARAWPEPSP
jgi:hypothetical protein